MILIFVTRLSHSQTKLYSKLQLTAKNHLENLKPTNHMKTNTTSATAQNAEVTLGWTSMPAYGEVMTTLAGTAHTDVMSTPKLEHKSVLNTFWNLLSSAK